LLDSLKTKKTVTNYLTCLTSSTILDGRHGAMQNKAGDSRIDFSCTPA
jgi:hypothetical protein